MPDMLSPIWANPQTMPIFSAREWEVVLGQAKRSRLLARLAYHFEDRGWLEAVPEGPRHHLKSAWRLVERQAQQVRWEVDCIQRALRNAETPVVLLKGAAYSVAGLPPSRGRIFSDIDILVRPDRVKKTESALLAAGWLSDERDAYNQRYYRQWMHEIPPLRHIERQSIIDLHHTITPPTSYFNVDGAKLMAGIRPIDGIPGLFTLAPADMVLHSAVHLFQEGEFGHGLRDLLDLNDLLLHFGREPEFWPTLLKRADEIKLGEPLFHALHHVRRLFGTAPPEQWQAQAKALQPHWFTRTTMSWMLSIALRPEHPSCDGPFSGFARWLLYVRSHYLRMPVHLLVPHLIRKAYMRRFPPPAPVAKA